jgi:glutamyl-tRNA reductase
LSVASTGVQWLDERLPLGRRVLVIGAGDTGTKAARHVRSLGAGTLVIANRTLNRAEALAATVGGIAVGLEGLAAELAAADAVICAAGSSDWLVTREDLARAALTSPLVVVDLAMPSAIEPARLLVSRARSTA